MVSERLVEEAAKAMLMVTQEGVSVEYAWSVQFDEVREELIAQARAALAVFEAAQAHTGDEREELSDMQCPEVDGSRRSHGRRERRRTISIEPLHDDEAVAAAVALRDAAQAARTGVEQLQLPEVDDDAQD